ncbi:putative serine/threonine-protein phosphatase 1 [Vibrio phage vB_VmeM-32]|nr:putative serine/threonine-protein phosphatase 1 [Vibrio phage vB_VmeM-32]
MQKLEKIDASIYKRVFVVGDIHGELTLLHNHLKTLNFDYQNDLLISVGDLIDRGEDSLGCLELINEKWFKTVRGNHEDLMIHSVKYQNMSYAMDWFRNGGTWYQNLTEDDKMWAKTLINQADNELPYVIELTYDDKKYVICHADWEGNIYRDDVDIDFPAQSCILWSRDRIENFNSGIGSRIDGAHLFIFGHTYVPGPTKFENCLYIDTGAVFGRHLTILEFGVSPWLI